MTPADTLAAEWPDRWPRPDPLTNEHHRSMVRGFAEAFAGRYVDTITRSEARAWALANPGKARYVRTMLNDALDEGLIEVNPFANLRMPAPREAPIVVPSAAQIAALCSVAPEPLLSMIPFAAYVGVRIGEHRALRRGDLEYGGEEAGFNRAKVERQLTRDGRVKHPKSERGRRRVLIPYPARACIERRLDVPDEYLWALSRDQHQRLWDKAREDAGVSIRWHDLRHHAATWFLDHGASIEDVAKQLGCDEELVRRRYGHPDPEKALERLERLVDPTREGAFAHA